MELNKVAHKLSNQMYCPECVNNQYEDNEDANYDWYIYTNVTERGSLEIRCKKCGYGAVYMTTFLEG